MGLHPAGFCTSPWPPGPRHGCTRSSSNLHFALSTAASVSQAQALLWDRKARVRCWHWGRRAQALQWRDVRQDVARLWPFLCLHSESVGSGNSPWKAWGVWSSPCCGHRQKHRLNPPQLPAQHRACAPQSWEGAGCILKGGFYTNILLLLADTEAQHTPALDISLALHLQAEHTSPSLATAPHRAQEEGGYASCPLWENIPLHSTIPCSVV